MTEPDISPSSARFTTRVWRKPSQSSCGSMTINIRQNRRNWKAWESPTHTPLQKVLSGDEGDRSLVSAEQELASILNCLRFTLKCRGNIYNVPESLMAILYLLPCSFSLIDLKKLQSWCLHHTLLSSDCSEVQYISWSGIFSLGKNLAGLLEGWELCTP